MMDVDHFKQFNDQYGHQSGNLVLQAVGKVLRSTIRRSDIPARYGGEEFAIIMPDTSKEDAIQAAERVRVKLEQTLVDSEHGPLSVTASFGIATDTGHESPDAGALIQRADEALYAAKKAGRNRIEAMSR